MVKHALAMRVAANAAHDRRNAWLVIDDWRLSTYDRRLTTGDRRLVTGDRRLVTGDWRLVTGDW